ncbi:hypothetical protein ACJMK2_044331 [Sinanodonta woodiana]|uniref:RNA helicase n=1 Tax=Sinanodonta woodiana TaxID=1069815 RepID=A0ABD3W3C9_SINWO
MSQPVAPSPLPRPASTSSQQSIKSNSSGWSDQNRNRGPRPNQPVCISEEVKIGVHLAVERFRMNEEQKELEFPSSLTATERAYIHRLCEDLGLKSRSRGKGADRFISIFKKEKSQCVSASGTFQLARNSCHQIHCLLQRFPVTNKERQELQPRTDKGHVDEASKEFSKGAIGRLNNGVPQVPPKRGDSELLAFRESLPITRYSRDILQAINNNQVVLVSGETGSGKTTQVPQMILDDCHVRGQPCRIICTQPRRLAALSMSERVSQERGEKVGQTVGFQIRLESRVSPRTLLTFCTNGVLLRTLMGGDSAISTVTHVIVDEVHERDRFSDFILIALRDLLPKFPHLKLVLMSAALNIQLFVKYFNNCPVVSVPGSLFNVQEFFLEDILNWTGYTNKKMEKYKKEYSKTKQQQVQLDEWCSKETTNVAEAASGSNHPHGFTEGFKGINTDSVMEDVTESMDSLGKEKEKEEVEPWLAQELDRLIGEVWLTGDEDLFSQILHLVLTENVSVDYQHSDTSATPLMVAAGRGLIGIVEQLLNLGADPSLKASNEWTALDWAKKFQHEEIIDMLEAAMVTSETGNSVDQGDAELDAEGQLLSDEDRDLLSIYQHSFDDEKVDVELIISLLNKILSTQADGAILIFLPGYDDIVTVRDLIEEDKSLQSTRYVLYILHSSMQSSDQKKVFRATPNGVRKIILATNIAETSITINDVVFVIDSGKVKEKTFDALLSISMLKSNWISKASALQRKGRAGRCQPGLCYHLFSRVRYHSMQDYATPEILRVPLQELCLHTKLLSPSNQQIADFLSKAPEAPPFLIIRNAVQLLYQMDALDRFEDLTELGHHLADLPVEPRLGKMVLNSIVLKCLDPVLTIVCALAYRDPFILPAQPYQKREATVVKKKFSAGTFSDHMCLLRAFQAWQKARTDGWERSFCDRNFLSSACMEMIVGMRAQLLGQLRASGFVRARGGGDIRDLNTNSENWAVVKAALCAGMYPNLVRVDRHKKVLVTRNAEKVKIHMSSVLNPDPSGGRIKEFKKFVTDLTSDWLLYEEMTRFNKMAFIRTCTLVSPITVAIFAGPAKLPADALRDNSVYSLDNPEGFRDDSDSENEDKDDSKNSTLQLDEWLNFKVDSEAANLVYHLRQKWYCLLMRRMRAPSKPWSQADEAVIRAVVAVLTNEEQALGLQQPAGIGQRPRPMSAETIMSGGGGGKYSQELGETKQRGPSTKKIVSTPPRREDFLAPKTYMIGSSRGQDSSPVNSASNLSSGNTSSANSHMGSKASTPSGSPETDPMGTLHDPGANTASQSRYFIMKCNSQKNLEVSQSTGLWATSGNNKRKLNKAFEDGKTVYLIFSVQGSGHFQGYTRVTSSVTQGNTGDFANSKFSHACSVEWIKRGNIPFQNTHHLLNPWNENKRVQISRDGQEVEPSVGEMLIKLWDRFPTFQKKFSADGQGQVASKSQSPLQKNNSIENEPDIQVEVTMGTDGYYSDFQQQNPDQEMFSISAYSQSKTQGQTQYFSNQVQGHFQAAYGQGQSQGHSRGHFHGNRGHHESGHYHHANSQRSSGMQVGGGYSQSGGNYSHLYMGSFVNDGGSYISPGQNVSPVMILQRDGNQRPHQQQPNSYSHYHQSFDSQGHH